MIESLIQGMKEYMEESDVDYDLSHIERCKTTMESYLDEIKRVKTREEALELVEQKIKELNVLVEETPDIIETGEREQICELFISSFAEMGFGAGDDDITEDYREW